MRNDPLDLRRLEFFLALAADLHFGRAAARCFVSRPAFSQQIMALEHHLGVPLFVREKSGVQLTAAGRDLLEPVSTLLRDARQIERAAGRSARVETGEFVLGYCDYAATTVMPEVAAGVRSDAPDAALSLIGYPWWTQAVEGLTSGQCDAAIVPRVPHDVPGIAFAPIASERLVAIVPAGHELAGETEVPLLRLAAEPFAAIDRGRSPGEFDLTMALFDTHAVRPGIAFRPHRLQDALAWVGSGAGVTLVPEELLTRANPYGVRAVPLADDIEALETVLAWVEDHDNPLLEIVREVAERVATTA
ncbi:LysR family transcriptional regulator [Patulibacter sp. NPDC049589]|uniref:LysR family transcriptional regulator n=1 Tax=Patulibacter sp. NPDC049589 TaxID=3154731 RepID=UPI003427FDE3